MNGVILRKYGTSTTIDFPLYQADGLNLRTDAAHASGDTKIMKDEGAEANTTNGFVDRGNGYSIALTAAEMQAARVVIYLVDQSGPKAWLDTVLVIETYGHASAMHPFDLGSASPAVSLSSAALAAVADAVLDENTSQHGGAGSLGAEVHLSKAMLANKRVHTISTAVDQIMDDDAISVLRTMTPTDGGDDEIDVEPS